MLCNFKIQDTLFDSNKADEEGGSFYWEHIEPTLAGVVFKNNSAKYGANYATFGVSLAFVSSRFPSDAELIWYIDYNWKSYFMENDDMEEGFNIKLLNRHK